MNILIAPNAFKESLSAIEAGREIALGLKESGLACTASVIPIADGGDGSLHVLAHHFDATLMECNVMNPLGQEITAKYAVNREKKLAIIELAEASGIRLIETEDLNPWIANTRGTGQLIEAAVKDGCETIYLTVGGSATIDGGIGILRALNVQFYADDEPFIPTGPCDFHKIQKINASAAIDRYANIRFIVLADVDNPLLGPMGAVHIFGRQKGLDEDEIELFETSMAHWSKLLSDIHGEPVGEIAGGGASGGVPVGLIPFFNVEIRSGAREILKLSGFDIAMQTADLIITTEGTLDQQTAFGKGPGWVAKLANEHQIPVIALCGQIADDYDPRASCFDAAFPINSMIYTLKTALARTRPNLRFTAMQVGNLLAKFHK